jgi:hypothetical protein
MKETNVNFDKYKAPNEAVLQKILSTLQGLRFGSVLITVHDSRVVQIERVDKVRLDNLNIHEKGDGI